MSEFGRRCPNWLSHDMPDFLTADEASAEECKSCRRRRHPSGLSHHVMAELFRNGWQLAPVVPATEFSGVFPLETQAIPGAGTPCVYKLLNAEGAVAYVGRSMTVRKRIQQHWQTPKKKPHLASWEVLVCDSAQHMVELEADLIRQYRPPVNQTTEVRSNRPWHG